jgi:hypothetical protein
LFQRSRASRRIWKAAATGVLGQIRSGFFAFDRLEGEVTSVERVRFDPRRPSHRLRMPSPSSQGDAVANPLGVSGRGRMCYAIGRGRCARRSTVRSCCFAPARALPALPPTASGCRTALRFRGEGPVEPGGRLGFSVGRGLRAVLVDRCGGLGARPFYIAGVWVSWAPVNDPGSTRTAIVGHP